MAKSIVGSTALITGGARRIGRELALALAEAGANVIVHYNRSRDEAEGLVSEIQKMSVEAASLQADLTAPQELASVVDRASEVTGRLDILINNASTFPESDFNSFTLDDLTQSIKTDAWPAVELGRNLAKQAENGSIINLLDYRLSSYDWRHVAYYSAKHLLELYTRMMAIEFAPRISVNAVAPGLILPPEGKDISYLENLKDRAPMKRIGDPQQVAEAVLYLVTSEYITGQTIYVDGGRHLVEASGG